MHIPHTDLFSDDDHPGFAEASRLLSCHHARSRVISHLLSTGFLDTSTVLAVHVDNISRVDRASLTAYDHDGSECGGDTIYIDHPAESLDLTPEFDHLVTGMPIPTDSALAQQVKREDGWVINLDAVRAHDLADDRRATQRAMVLAHLSDMLGSGQARGFIFGSDIDDSGEAS